METKRIPILEKLSTSVNVWQYYGSYPICRFIASSLSKTTEKCFKKNTKALKATLERFRKKNLIINFSEDDEILERENFVHSEHLNYNLFFEEVSRDALERIRKFLHRCAMTRRFCKIKQIKSCWNSSKDLLTLVTLQKVAKILWENKVSLSILKGFDLDIKKNLKLKYLPHLNITTRLDVIPQAGTKIGVLSIDVLDLFPYLSKNPKSVEPLLTIMKQDIHAHIIQVRDERGLKYINSLKNEQISKSLRESVRYIHVNSYFTDDFLSLNSYQKDLKSKFPFFRWIKYFLDTEEALSTLPITMYICNGEKPYTVIWESVLFRRKFITKTLGSTEEYLVLTNFKNIRVNNVQILSRAVPLEIKEVICSLNAQRLQGTSKGTIPPPVCLIKTDDVKFISNDTIDLLDDVPMKMFHSLKLNIWCATMRKIRNSAFKQDLIDFSNKRALSISILWGYLYSVQEWFATILNYLECEVSSFKIDFSCFKLEQILDSKYQDIRRKVVEKLVSMITLEKFELKLKSGDAEQVLVYNKFRDSQQKKEVLWSILNQTNLST